MASSEMTEETSAERRDGVCLLCLKRLTEKLRLVEDGATPPDWKYIGLVFLALFSSASTLTFLFPFLPEMMLTLGYSETDKGTYVGIVASSVFAGRIVGSVFWGWLADRHGRKLVLLITIALNGIFAGLFGFADNLVMAVIFRFLCGAVNGTVGTAKTILYDISDNTNQAVSMSMLSISWGMGMIVGPTVGGLLASPAVKWPGVFSQDGLFGQFPYLLSSLFPFMSCIFVFIIIFFKFDETFVVKSSKRIKQDLEVSEPGENENNTNGKESHHPLLGELSNKSQNSLSQICQSMYSIHAEAESAACMARASVQPGEPKEVNHPLVCRTQSVPGTNNTPSSLEHSTVFNSESNIPGNYHNGTNMHIISENLTKNGKSDFPNTLLYNELKTRLTDTIDNDCQKHNQNILNELENESVTEENVSSRVADGNGFFDHNDYKKVETANWKTEEDDACTITQEVKIVKYEAGNEKICGCVECLCRLSCCRNSSFYKLLRLSDVWASVMIYTVFSMITIAVEDIFPIFASTRKDYGGLGFSTNEIGFAMGAIYLPLLFLQIKLYPYLVSKIGIRKVFMFSAMVCLVTCQCIPMVRLLNDNPVWLWICLLAVQIPFKIATNCCFAGTSLLVNNSVSQELAGQANGVAMMTTAMGRTIAPVLAGILFTWTVTYGQDIGPPFDTSFPFFILGAIFFVTIFECLHLNPNLDKQKK